MFELGFPPVPTSIVNVKVDKRYAKDISQPFSLLEFIKIVSNIVDTNNITAYYNHYITLWNSNKNKQSSISKNLIIEGYRNFIKDLTLNYNSQAENKFLSNIDYSDPYDLDVALKFIANKIQSIALYYRDKREDVKLETSRKKYKASTKGLVISIKERIIEFLKNNNNKTIKENIDAVSKNLIVSIDPLYDGEVEYFNKTPNSSSYGSYDRDYNEDVFLRSNSELVFEIFSGLSNIQQKLQEVDDIFNNKRDLTKKYMGTDFYYVSATPVLSSAPVLNIKSDFNIRYNKDFIRLLTTTLPFTGVDVDIPLTPSTTPPVTPNLNTLPEPIDRPSFEFDESKYDCVNGTCLKRKNGQFKTKKECLENCTNPIDPQPDPKPGPKPGPIPAPCDCKNLSVLDVAVMRVPRVLDVSLEQGVPSKDCLDSDEFDEYIVQQSVLWNCPDTNTQVEITVASGSTEDLEPKTPVILRGGDGIRVQRFDKKYKIPCGTDILNLALGFRGIITTPSGQVITCYPSSNPMNVTQSPCCTATTPSPSGTTTTTIAPSSTTCPPCPEDTGDTDESDNPPELPSDTTTITPSPSGSSVTPSPSGSPCPDCPPSSYNSSQTDKPIKGEYQPTTEITSLPLGDYVNLPSTSTTQAASTSTTTLAPNPSTTTLAPNPSTTTLAPNPSTTTLAPNPSTTTPSLS